MRVTEAHVRKLYEAWEAEQTITARPRPQLLDRSFTEQAAFIEDPSKLKVVLCTRRAGKSYGAGLYLYKEAYENPGVSCLYIALTRDSAKKIMWKDVLKAINRKHGLGVKFNETELTATLHNGSVIYLLGVDSTEEEKRKLLGQKYKLVIVDESAQFTIDLNELVFGVLKPAVADYRGTICLIGTPANIKAGLYFELTNGADPSTAHSELLSGWTRHCWSATYNPYMRKQWAEEIAELKANNPRIEETPLFQQHYLGKWVIDESKLVYKYSDERNQGPNELPQLPRGTWHFVLGCDLGYEDPTAFAVCAYHDYLNHLCVLECSKEERLDVTSVARRIESYRRRFDIERVIIDNSNKQAVAEMEQRHGIPLTPADKRGKSDFIEIMNGEFIMGNIKLSSKCQALKDEYANLIWDEQVLARTGKREEHASCANHCADATLYAWRYTYSYLAEELKLKPRVPSPEAYAIDTQKQIDEHWAAEVAELDRQHQEENEGLESFFEWNRESNV